MVLLRKLVSQRGRVLHKEEKSIELEVVPKRSGGWKTIDTTSGVCRVLVGSERALGEGWAMFQEGKGMESVTRLKIKLLFFLSASFVVV